MRSRGSGRTACAHATARQATDTHLLMAHGWHGARLPCLPRPARRRCPTVRARQCVLHSYGCWSAAKNRCVRSLSFKTGRSALPSPLAAARCLSKAWLGACGAEPWHVALSRAVRNSRVGCSAPCVLCAHSVPMVVCIVEPNSSGSSAVVHHTRTEVCAPEARHRCETKATLICLCAQGPWSAEEDEQLRELVKAQGVTDKVRGPCRWNRPHADCMLAYYVLSGLRGTVTGTPCFDPSRCAAVVCAVWSGLQ